MQKNVLPPIPEKSYLRIVYLGKLRLVPRLITDDVKSDQTWQTPTLEEMIREIWEKAKKYNEAHFISGHLACSQTLHVVQLLEGEKDEVLSLIERIRKDPRVNIEKEFRKELLTMNLGWGISSCNSFSVTPAALGVIQRNDISLKSMFRMIKNTYQAKRDKLKLRDFYKSVIETMLLKYMHTEGQGLKVLRKSGWI